MIEINLLPEEYKKRSFSFSMGKTSFYGIAAAVCIILMLIAVTFYQMNQITEFENNIQKAKQRAAMLKKDIKVVDALIDVKTKINQRMAAVERLDSHRSSWVKILENIAKDVPEFVWLARFEELGSANPPEDNKKDKNKNKKQNQTVKVNTIPNVMNVEIEGYCFTLNSLASFMINMMRSDYFESVELISSEEKKLDKKHKAYNFVLTCNLHYLSDENLRNMIAQNKTNQGKSQKNKTSHKVLN